MSPEDITKIRADARVLDENGDFFKLTVNLIPNNMVALASAADRCGDSFTDTVNRAIVFYEVMTRRKSLWHRLRVVWHSRKAL